MAEITPDEVRAIIERKGPIKTYEEWREGCQRLMEMGGREEIFEMSWKAVQRANLRPANDGELYVMLSRAALLMRKEGLDIAAEGPIAECLDGIWRRMEKDQQENAELALKREQRDG